MESALTIGGAARAADVGVETIRFYERNELIQQPAKARGAGPRRYSAEVIERIRFIRETQQLGFTLGEVRELLALRADPATDCSDVRERATAKLAVVRRKLERLQRIGGALERLVESCSKVGPLESCTILSVLTSPRPCDGNGGAAS